MEIDETLLVSPAHDATQLLQAKAPDGPEALEAEAETEAAALTQSISAGEALLHAERLRINVVAPLMVSMAVVVAATLPLFGGNPWAKLALWLTMAIGVMGLSSLWWRAYRRQPVSGWQAAVAWSGALAATCANTVCLPCERGWPRTR